MRIGGVLIFFFLGGWGEYVRSSQMSMKSHRDIMKLSKRPLDVVFFQSMWPQCEEIGHFIRKNFCTWSSVKWIEKQRFSTMKLFDLSFHRYLPSIFIVFWLCVSTNLQLDYFLNLLSASQGLNSELWKLRRVVAQMFLLAAHYLSSERKHWEGVVVFQSLFLLAAKCFPPRPLLGWLIFH